MPYSSKSSKVIIENETLSVISSVKDVSSKNFSPADLVFFQKAKDQVLGKKYELSLVFVGTTLIKNLNKKYRNKDYPTDILSFNVTENVGELFISPTIAKRKSASFERNYENYLKFIFIHGLFHLKGLDHSSKMESEEQKVRNFFKI